MLYTVVYVFIYLHRLLGIFSAGYCLIIEDLKLGTCDFHVLIWEDVKVVPLAVMI